MAAPAETKKDQDSFERTVFYGPMRYVPQPREWIHEFKWHGADPNDKCRQVKDAHRFHLLSIIPDCLYYNVKEVSLPQAFFSKFGLKLAAAF